jgi:hypothetical protein
VVVTDAAAPAAPAVVVVEDVGAPGFDRVVTGEVAGVTTPDTAGAPAVVGVLLCVPDELPDAVGAPGAPPVAVVVWLGGTPLQIWAYEGATPGGGSLELAGSPFWNFHPSTSSGGLETDCPAGPLLA